MPSSSLSANLLINIAPPIDPLINDLIQQIIWYIDEGIHWLLLKINRDPTLKHQYLGYKGGLMGHISTKTYLMSISSSRYVLINILFNALVIII